MTDGLLFLVEVGRGNYCGDAVIQQGWVVKPGEAPLHMGEALTNRSPGPRQLNLLSFGWDPEIPVNPVWMIAKSWRPM